MGSRPLGSTGNYPPIAFSVPRKVADAAREGIRLRERFGRGGTDVGIDRAKQLSATGAMVTLRDLVHMRSYFARHAADNLDDRNPPSNGRIAWLLWGGFAGQRWTQQVHSWAVKSGYVPPHRSRRGHST